MNRPRRPGKIIALSCALAAMPIAAPAQTSVQTSAQDNVQTNATDSTAPQNWGAPEIVEVQAKPGPAVWHLIRGDAEVWILGTVGAMPDDLKWNKDYLAELLSGARAIVMPPRASIGVFEGAWFLLTNGSKFSLSNGQKLDAILPPDLDARFAAVRQRLGKSVSHYDTDTAMRAAVRLQEDVADKLDLTRDEPRDTIRRLADNKHVPAAPVARYEVLDAARDILKLTPAQQQVCLDESVADAGWDLDHAIPAADAWAVGDIKGVKANYGEARLANCVIAAVHSVADISERDVADYIAAINDALNKPGKTIAVIDVGPLLKKNGVLERLQAMHVTIEGPAE